MPPQGGRAVFPSICGQHLLAALAPRPVVPVVISEMSEALDLPRGGRVHRGACPLPWLPLPLCVLRDLLLPYQRLLQAGFPRSPLFFHPRPRNTRSV
jgi:hypothetical protein